MVKQNPNILAKILAIETSGRNLNISLAQGEESLLHLGEISLNIGYQHSSLLKESSEFLLKKVGWKLSDLTHLAVSSGPGSFTGLRVGIAFMRALSSALKIPLLGIPTFELLAKRFENLSLLPVTILIDSIGEELFIGVFNRGALKPSQNYGVIRLSKLLKKIPQQKRLYVGEGFLRYEKEIVSKMKGVKIKIPLEMHTPRSKDLAELLYQRLQVKKIPKSNWKKVVPFYCRPPLAVERLGNIPRTDIGCENRD